MMFYNSHPEVAPLWLILRHSVQMPNSYVEITKELQYLYNITLHYITLQYHLET